MGDSYEKVKESERVEAIRERARIVVDTEKRFPKSHRYHRFMHFVEAADSTASLQEKVWEGVTRRVTDLVTTKTDRLDCKLELLEAKLDGVEGELTSKLEILDSKLAAQESKLDMLLERLK